MSPKYLDLGAYLLETCAFNCYSVLLLSLIKQGPRHADRQQSRVHMTPYPPYSLRLRCVTAPRRGLFPLADGRYFHTLLPVALLVPVW